MILMDTALLLEFPARRSGLKSRETLRQPIRKAPVAQGLSIFYPS